MTEDDDAYDVEWASPALRAIDRLPEKLATAVIEFVYTSLATSATVSGVRCASSSKVSTAPVAATIGSCTSSTTTMPPS